MKNVFLADDDADDRMFFVDALKEIDIPTLLTLSKDGSELMDNLETIKNPPPPHVIFLDLNMPLKNGYDCLRSIRESSHLKNIPIVIFSTTSNQDAIDKAYHHGANYFLCKPRSFQLLVRAIEMVLTRDLWYAPQPPKDKFVLAVA